MRSRRQPVIMNDVARAAGVSLMTVSNVVNGRFDEMSEATRRRVEGSIRALNYIPHSMARNLRRSQRLSVGLVIVDRDQMYLTHPGHAYVVAGLSSYLNGHGYSLTVQGLDPDDVANVLALKKIDVDALCIVHSGNKTERRRTIQLLAEASYPCVVIHERNVSLPDVCCIRADDYMGGYMLASHLIEQGCKDLLMVQPETIWASMEERVRGIKTACRKVGIRSSIIRCDGAHVERAHAALSSYLERSRMPDGILACHDQMGIAIQQFLKSRSIKIPNRVRVTGFNAFELWKYSDPLLTTIRAPAAELGKAAGEQLIRRITNGSFSNTQIVLPVEFVQGAST